jgi:hypothetical protein
MPFDLVIDGHTADGQEARVSKTSVAGSWGAVAGNLRFFADRFGIARAGIEGTTISYDLVRRYAVLESPKIVLGGPRKHQRLLIERRRSYFGFELDTELEPIDGEAPAELQEAARDVLAQALMESETTHPDQHRLRRSIAELDELWRRSGGRLTSLSPAEIKAMIGNQLQKVSSWQDFISTKIVLDASELVDEETRKSLEALPGHLHIRGDAVPLDYEVEGTVGVARVRLREGQVKRLRPDDLPRLDRPLRFAVQRGHHPPILAATIPDLQALLQRGPRGPDGQGRSADNDGGRKGRRRHGRKARGAGRPPRSRG